MERLDQVTRASSLTVADEKSGDGGLDSLSAVDALSKFISDGLLARIADNKTKLQCEEDYFNAAILFADISGFTSLTEDLVAKYGSEQAVGAEHLTLLISEYFDKLIEVAESYGGDVVKFAGDAVLILFPVEDNDFAVRVAVTCALKMQEVAKRLSQKIKNEKDLCLSLKIAISYGSIRGMILGGVLDRWEYAVVSDAIINLETLGKVALPGDVIISRESLSLLGDFCGEFDQRDEDCYSIGSIKEWQYQSSTDSIGLTEDHIPMIKSFVPAAVANRISAGQVDVALISELRHITVLFINLPDFKPDIDLEAAQRIVTCIQQVCYGQRGSLDKISSDDKGVSLIAGFGVPPMSAEDDAERAVKAALNVKTALEAIDVQVSIGVASGPVYCGTLGDKRRCEYTLMGDGVNTAARLMSKAKGGILCDSATFEQSSEKINFKSAGLLELKGKSNPLPTYNPLSVISVQKNENTYFVGRNTELAIIEQLIDQPSQRGIGRGVLIVAEAGIGKSAVLSEVVRRRSEEADTRVLIASASTTQTSFFGVWRELVYEALGFDELTSSEQKKDFLDKLIERNSRVKVGMLPLLNEIFGLDLEESDQLLQMQNEIRAENIHTLMAYILREIADGRTLIIIIDDAHWMDSASWLLLDSIARSVAEVIFIMALQNFVGKPPNSYTRLATLSSVDEIKL